VEAAGAAAAAAAAALEIAAEPLEGACPPVALAVEPASSRAAPTKGGKFMVASLQKFPITLSYLANLILNYSKMCF
jgi:hypothetical protein